MKKLLNITLLFLTVVLLFSCRTDNDSNIPVDVHEHEEIEKVVVKLTNNSNGKTQVVNFIDGKAVNNGHFHLSQGGVYNVELDFQVKQKDGNFQSTDVILKEKDHHFITYQFTGADIKVKRRDDDVVRTDGKKLGIKTKWTISTFAAGKVNIKLMHGSTSVDDNAPSADNQLGGTVGGHSDVDIFIDFH